MAYELICGLWVGNDNSGVNYDFISTKNIHTIINMNSNEFVSVSTVKRMLSYDSPISSIIDALKLCNEEDKSVLIYGSSQLNYISIEVFDILIQYLKQLFPSMTTAQITKCIYSKIPDDCWESVSYINK